VLGNSRAVLESGQIVVPLKQSVGRARQMVPWPEPLTLIMVFLPVIATHQAFQIPQPKGVTNRGLIKDEASVGILKALGK